VKGNNMRLSLRGQKMSGVSGVRTILADIAEATRSGDATQWLNLGAGNPARIPEVERFWQELAGETLSGGLADISGGYGPSRGTDELLDAIVSYFNDKYGWGIDTTNVVVGPGSQMLCFAAAAVFTGPCETGHLKLVLPSVPDYTGYQGLALEHDTVVGVDPSIRLLDDRSFRYDFDLEALHQVESIGMLLVSSPSNPTGRAIDATELSSLVGFARQRQVPLVIDHAYGAPFPRVAATAVEPAWHPEVINCFTLSKAGLPGERLGFAIGPSEAIDSMVACLANSVLHAPQLVQGVLARALRGGRLDALASDVIAPYYRDKRIFAEKLLSASLPEDIPWRMHAADGGLFCWIWVDSEWFDDLVLYEALKREKVSIVPGRYFFPVSQVTPFLREHASRCFRLSLSAEESVIADAVDRIARALVELRRCAPR
jgi:valine--pyruvate aminotransferase